MQKRIILAAFVLYLPNAFPLLNIQRNPNEKISFGRGIGLEQIESKTIATEPFGISGSDVETRGIKPSKRLELKTEQMKKTHVR